MSQNQNNPFRNKSGSLNIGHNNGEENGSRRKFQGGSGRERSNRGGRGGHVRGRNDRRTGDLTTKEKNWGRVKFNPVAASARVEAATPWRNFKTDFIQTQQEAKITTEDVKAQEFRKKREENYRKRLIMEKQKEPTKWEDFGEANNKKPTKFNANKQKSETNEEQKPRPFISDEVLKNFDSKKLNFAQNNHLRKVIQRTSYLAKGHSLSQVVKELSAKPVKRLKAK